MAWPDYRGNGVMASLGTSSANGHAGPSFIDFFLDPVGPPANARAVGRSAGRWARIDVDEAYVNRR